MKPFVKWLGGKTNLLKIINKEIPSQFNSYYEPFVGSGALFFSLQKKLSYISDLNHELITSYETIKKKPFEVIDLLEFHKKNYSKEYFYKISKLNNLENKVHITARFIFLNKTCYSGLHRVNKKNEFNSAFGYLKNPSIFDKDNILLISKFLQNTDIKLQCYSKINPQKDDFVFLDPPYFKKHKYSYTKNFDEKSYERLKMFCDNLTKKKVKFILTINNCDFIKSIFSDFFTKEIIASRNFNCYTNKNRTAKELLIKNFIS